MTSSSQPSLFPAIAQTQPVHSCQLVFDQQAARKLPTGRLQLALHEQGFIANPHFEPLLQSYDESYEETQSFSAHFRGESRRLIDWLDTRFDLAGKTVFEAGCGKGYFLQSLCAISGARGIGVDPSFRDDRADIASNDRLTFIKDILRPDHAHFTPDLTICRHTLEHLADPLAFLKLLREVTPTSGHLFLDVPNAARVADEGAFWDIYYEHCNYFTADSLVHLAEMAGWQVIESGINYHDQHIWLLAQPTMCAPKISAHAQPCDLLERIDKNSARQLRYWRQMLREKVASGRKTYLWGGGSKAVAFTHWLSADAQHIEAAIDINPHKQGGFLPGSGHPVISPSALISEDIHPEDLIIIMNPAYLSEIKDMLTELEVKARLIAVGLPCS